MTIIVNKDTQRMTVTVTNGNTTATREIDITTGVVSHDPRPNTDISRTTDSNGHEMHPSQMPNGTYNVIASDNNPTGDASFGDTWLVTDANREIKDVNGETFVENGFDIHQTNRTITNGCIGVKQKEDMDWLSNQYDANDAVDPDSTTVTVTGGEPDTTGESDDPNEGEK